MTHHKPVSFLHSELQISDKQVVQVVLRGHAADVLLLDGANYAQYAAGLPYEPQAGGHYTTSPVILRPPRPGAWHVVVDLGGRGGEVRAAVSIRPAGRG